MRNLVAVITLAAVGGVTAGLIAGTTPTLAADESVDPAVLRKDDMITLVSVVDDDDDDDTADGDVATSRTGTTFGTGSSRSRADATNSRYDLGSRDRDRSRGDKTKDWTDDGAGPKKRDWSVNKTNDRSLNDTRRGARS